MTTNVTAAGSVGSLAQLLATRSGERQERPEMPPPPPPGASNKMEQDLKSVLAELGLSGKSEEESGESTESTAASGGSLDSFMASLMDALHAQQEGSKAIATGSSDNPMKLDLQSLLGQLDGEGEPGSEVSALQSQFSSLLESSGNSSSGVTLKDLLSAFASKIPSDAPDRKGYMVDTQA
ncbi:hypothetical protein [Aeromonas dhakensis]|uniref:hypothetical protein n=2 Tax=Aeromonas dhakensis TaxID=196024 RepID=UPI00227B1705|nr:hypothetical protein [Aeromonas dhakensis]MDD9212466.1 hypothetical protein [Aeromonas dhakensis]WAF73451.1 hypothetical protein NRK99_03965 [Aeromonas dhakensis]